MDAFKNRLRESEVQIASIVVKEKLEEMQQTALEVKQEHQNGIATHNHGEGGLSQGRVWGVPENIVKKNERLEKDADDKNFLNKVLSQAYDGSKSEKERNPAARVELLSNEIVERIETKKERERKQAKQLQVSDAQEGIL